MARKDYRLEAGRLHVATDATANVQLYIAPTADEQTELIGGCRIDRHTLESALDPEEASRIDVDETCTFVVWKRPRSAAFRNDVLFDVSSLGFVLQADRLTIIAADDPPDLERTRTRPVDSLPDLLLRIEWLLAAGAPCSRRHHRRERSVRQASHDLLRVLSGLMDARGNIINNNMNTLLKQLMVLNTVFLPLGVLVGALGMSEYSMMTGGAPWWISYPAFLVVLAGVAVVTWLTLRVWMNRRSLGATPRRTGTTRDPRRPMRLPPAAHGAAT